VGEVGGEEGGGLGLCAGCGVLGDWEEVCPVNRGRSH